jgi:hypothetical protein
MDRGEGITMTDTNKDNDEAQIEEPAPDAEGTMPTEADEAPPTKLVKIGTKATVEWYEDDGETVATVESVHRGLFPVFLHLMEAKKKHPERSTKRVFVYITAENEKGIHKRLKIVDDVLDNALENLGNRVQPSVMAMQKLQMIISQMAEVSALKGIVLTAVFGEAQCAGFGFVSESIEVTEEDLKVLGESAANQADMFKSEIRKNKGIAFPSDSDIITPDQLRGGKVIVP